MKLKHLIGPVALLGVLVVSLPAQAQGRREQRNRSAENRGESARREQAAPRSQPADRGRAQSQTPDRPSGGDRQAGAARNQAVPRVDTYRGDANRGNAYRGDTNRGNAYRGDAYRGNVYGGNRPRTVIVQPRGGYRSYGYRSSTFTFRPRLRVGFGVFLGYPVPYPYYDPYAYPSRVYGSPYPGYGYPAAGPGYQVGPGATTAYGGVSLDISPRDAAVYVDGTYAGVADDFYDPSQPLSVRAGRHRIELQAPGLQPLVFDVDVVPGQVIPYQGDLQP
jgi:hypothetical protein